MGQNISDSNYEANVLISNSSYKRGVIIWLVSCALLVLVMTALGGYTRLTDSGLSMTNWHPVHGIIPPLNDTQWDEEFANYKQSPEYLKLNNHFGLEEFKEIFWVEYLHRLLGRIIGLVFLLPFIFFVIRGKVDRILGVKLFGVFILGGIQGGVGWYMVASGLVNDPYVSHYRLAVHLLLSMLIFSIILWITIGLLQKQNIEKTGHLLPNNNIKWLALLFGTLIVMQTILGAFTAGLDAGYMYNSFPLMDDELLPETMWHDEPWYNNFTENPVMVQFLHRINAFLVSGIGLLLWFKTGFLRKCGAISMVNWTLLPLLLIGQVVLGIVVLVNIVPITLAILHQVMAFILFGISLVILHTIMGIDVVKYDAGWEDVQVST